MFLKIALIAHIAAGSVSLVSGLLAIIFRKGFSAHKMAGSIYFFAMIFVCLSAISISLAKQQSFLLHIGIFSGYLVYSGFQAVKNKSYKPHVLDWVLLAISLINAGFMILSMNIILLVFGGLGLILSMGDLRVFRMQIIKREIPKSQWLVRHIGMMLGAYISTFTAFLVVNMTHVDYPVLIWLLPTMLGTPLIVFWTRKAVRTTPKS